MAGQVYWVVWSESSDPDNLYQIKFKTIMAQSPFLAAQFFNKDEEYLHGHIHVFPAPTTFNLED